MRIGIVTTWFERGAAYVSKQFKEVWEKEAEIFIYVRGGEKTAKNDSNWDVDNITYGKRYSYTKLDLINKAHFKTWILDNDLDVVFFNEQHIWTPVAVANELGVITGSYVDYYTKATINLFGAYDFLVCNTRRHYDVFSWHPQAYYIPWGTDTTIFNEKQKKESTDTSLTFFHSAGMNPYRKGTDHVINAFRKLENNKAKLLIHTQVDLATFFPSLTKEISRLVSLEKLEIINKTISAPGLYYRGDVYVYPTRLEGIGLTIAEANACGLPVLTTNEQPMNEFIRDGLNGKLIKVEKTQERSDGYYWPESEINTAHLATLMNYYLENINVLEGHKQRALDYASTNLSWQKNSEDLLVLLKRLKKIEHKSKLNSELVDFEKKRGIKFHIASSVLYQDLKRFIKNKFT